MRATDRVVYVVVKSGWSGHGQGRASAATTPTTPYTLTVSLEEAGANAELEPNDELRQGHAAAAATGYKEGFLSPKGDVDYYVLTTTRAGAGASVELSGVERLDLVLSRGGAARRETGSRRRCCCKANDGAVKEPERLNNVSCSGTCYFRVEGAARKVEGKWVTDYENAEQPYRLTVTAVPDNGSEEREPNNTAERATPLTLGKAGARHRATRRRTWTTTGWTCRDRPVRTPLRATLLGILKVDVGLYLHRAGRGREADAGADVRPGEGRRSRRPSATAPSRACTSSRCATRRTASPTSRTPTSSPSRRASSAASLPVDKAGPRSLLWPSLDAVVAQLVEHELPKLGVAGSNPVRRSKKGRSSPRRAGLSVFWPPGPLD